MTKEEAIDKVRAMKLSPGKDAELIIALHTLIPELRESEDERIRRTLVEYFGPEVQLDFVRGIPIQKIRDWLDKQKEQKQTDLPAGFYYIDLNGNRYYSKEFRYGDMKLKVGEQKPVLTAKEAWKEMRLEVYAQASGNRHEPNYSDDSTKMFSLCDIDEIFEKIGNSTVEQKPTEWSEEDERMLSRCEKSIESSKQFADSDTFKKAKDNEIDWLENRFKSLRPSWKPSEEQMRALNKVVNGEVLLTTQHESLESLYEQLKKL